GVRSPPRARARGREHHGRHSRVQRRRARAPRSHHPPPLMPISNDTRRVWAGRLSVAVAVTFVIIGALRFATDTLHEFNPDYWRPLIGTPFRYLVRAPSDGTVPGFLNAQFFKILSIPAGLCLVWLGVRFGSGTLAHKAERFRDLAVRGTWALSFL